MNTNRTTITTTIGYMAWALAFWMISMPHALWLSDKLFAPAVNMEYPLAILLFVMGILAFLQDQTLDSIVFFGGGGLLWVAQLAITGGAMGAASYFGWFYFIWAVFLAYVWVGSFSGGFTGIVRMLFLLGAWLSLLALAIGSWASLGGFVVLGGYIGLVTAILAGIVSASSVIAHGLRGAAPTTAS